MTKFLPTLLSASMVRGSHGVGSCTTLKGQSSFRPVMSSRHGHQNSPSGDEALTQKR